MKRTILIIILILASNFGFAQIADIRNYKLSNIGYISIPSEMELQSGNYKKLANELQKEVGMIFGFEVSGNRIVFQQSGLNDFDKGAFSSYARVILETGIGSFGDYEKITTNYSLTPTEINELSKDAKNQIQQSFIGTNLKLISWYGISTVKVNGRTALKTSYLRQLNDNPYVVVNIYTFQNNDRVHTLTFSYRQSDEITWKPLFSEILNSFNITNVR